MFLKMKIYQRVILLVWLSVSAGELWAALNPEMCETILDKKNETSLSTTAYTIDLKSPSGQFVFYYDADNIPDQFEIRLGEETIFQTGCVSDIQTNTVSYNSVDGSSLATIWVKPNCGDATLASSTWSVSASICPSQTVSTAEYNALVALYDSTGGDNWYNRSGWKQNKDVCSWYGVLCDSGKVSSLDLRNNNLHGEITPKIGDLLNLGDLLLDNNQLIGMIPLEITKLKKMLIPDNIHGGRYLSLYGNQLCTDDAQVINFLTTYGAGGDYKPCSQNTTAEYDALMAFFNATGGSNWTNKSGWGQNKDICSWYGVYCGNSGTVRELFLNSNNLVGTIPAAISKLTDIEGLYLQKNQLTGSIPTEIGNLTKLKDLSLWGNQLTGTIPTVIGNLAALTSLDLAVNQLTGSIPDEIGNLVNLSYLSLGENELKGNIPISFTNLKNLRVNTKEGYSVGLWNNHLCTTNPVVQAFLDNKASQDSVAYWKSGQTNTPCDPSYAINQSTTSIGYDHTKHATPLTLSGELKDNLVTFTVKKTDGSAFSQNGTLYLKVGSFEKYGAVRTSKPVKRGDLQITFDAVNNDNYPNYPKMYFARFESSETAYHAYAGPIIMSKRDDSTSTSTFNGNITSYLNGDKLIFEYVDPENDYKGGLSWYVNDDLTNVKATGKQLVVPTPTLSNANPIYYVTLKSDANEWLYSYPPLKDTYEFASFRNYTFKVAKGKKDKAVVVSVGDKLFEVTANGEFIPFTGQQLNRGHNTDFNLPLGNISSFSNTPITIFEGVENDGYKTPDVPALGLDVKSRQLIDIDPLTNYFNRPPNKTRRANLSTSDFNKALDELERSNLLPDGYKPSNIRSEAVNLTLNIMASHIGAENVKSFLDKIAKRVTGVIDIKEAIDSLGLLVSQLDEADLNGTPEGIKGLYVLDFLMSNTPLSKYLAFHGLIKPITQQIEQLDKVLNEKNCSFWAGPVKLSIFEEGGWLAFDREMSEIEQVQLFPIKLTYGDGVTATSEFVSLEKRAKNPITLTQKSGVWTYNSSDIAAMGSIFLDSLHLYCGAWMIAAKAGNKMYYGRTTIRNNGNSPSTIVVSPSN